MQRQGVILLIFAVLLFMAFTMQTSSIEERDKYPIFLSEYGFFEEKLADLKPKNGIIRYELNTPLFSDYAEKIRFIAFPKGEKAIYHASEVVDFPKGTTIIKSFFYPKDARKPEKGRQLIETRLLINEEKGWTALPYIWNEEQTEAFLEVAGGDRLVEWRDKNGKKKSIDYSIPNKNQCKGCHLKGSDLIPIGPSARQLNRDIFVKGETVNQLEYWKKENYLFGVPKMGDIPKMAVWDDVTTGSLDERARAYLDANCAYCHNPDGPANTSGLFLNIQEEDSSKWGVYKTPIAAGRGSGNRLYNIVPGKPNESILIYRMESEDPGVMMPELSRQLIHKEGVQLIRDWIEQIK